MSDLQKVMAEKTIGAVPDAVDSAPISTESAEAEMDTAIRPIVDDEFKAPIDEDAKALALTIAEAADDRKAGDITILETGNISYLADYFVILTGFSNVQVRAIANAIEGAVEDKFGRQPLRTEGMSEGRCGRKDYGEVIAHIFMPSDREYYDLEAFWGHAERVVFTPTSVN